MSNLLNDIMLELVEADLNGKQLYLIKSLLIKYAAAACFDSKIAEEVMSYCKGNEIL